MADKWFDYSTYMANKRAQLNAADPSANWTAEQVADAFEQAGFKGVDGAQQHFEQYGHTAEENLSPNANFIPSQYYIFKAADYFDKAVADVTGEQAAYIQAAIKDAGMSAWDHYTQYGTKEGINPSNNFDTQKYLEAKAAALNAAAAEGKTNWDADAVADAFAAAGMNALEHAMVYADGSEGEAAAAFDAAGKPTGAYAVDSPISEEGETYTLTTDPDNIPGTSGDDVINGYIDTTTTSTTSTFTSADVINGADGTDTFNITVEGDTAITAANQPKAQITNVEKFMIRDLNAGGPSTWNFASIEGETEVWADRASANLTLSNLGTGTAVGVKGATGVPNGTVTFTMATPTDAVNLIFDGAGTTAPAPAVTNNGAATEATITATGSASNVGAVTLANAASVKNVTIKADANLTMASLANITATDASMTVGGSASNVTITADTAAQSIDASGLTAGGMTVALANTKAVFNGGAGADAVTVKAALEAGAAIDLGAGDDTIIADGGSISKDVTVDGGAGTDALGLSVVDAANASVFANFETLILDGVTASQHYDLELLEKSTFTKMVINGTTAPGAAAAVDNISATGANLEVTGVGSGNGVVYNVKDAATGKSDSFTVTFADTAADQTSQVSATINDVETINVVSGGKATANSFTLVTNNATGPTQTVTVKASGSVDLAVDMSGAGSANDTYTLDAGGLTGKLIMTDNAGLNPTPPNPVVADKSCALLTKIIGGSNDDLLITVTGVATTVDLSKGGNDSVNVTASVNEAGLTTITGASAGDKIITKSATATGTIGTAMDLGGKTNMHDVLDALAQAATATTVTWAAVGDTIYAATGGNALADVNLIALTGVETLEGSAIAAGVITLA